MITTKTLIARKYAETVAQTEYTAANCTTLIDKFTATNVSASNATLTVYLPAIGESAGLSNKVLASRTIAPNETYNCPELVGQVLAASGAISVECGTENAIVISAAGREIT